MSNGRLGPLLEAITRLEELWADAVDASVFSRPQLVEANEELCALRRRIDGLHAEIAAAIAHESRRELGADGLAKEQGFRSATAMIAATTGGSSGDAARLIRVGEATAPRTNLVGDPLPAPYPAVQQALQDGAISMAAAALIVALLERIRLKTDLARIEEAERLLTERAAGLSLDDVRKLLTHAEAWLDPDGVEPREQDAHRSRSLRMFERNGSLHIHYRTDIASGAPVKAAIQAYVNAVFQAEQNVLDPDAPDSRRRSLTMIQADALTAICEHVLGCDNDDLPLGGATVVVRATLADLLAGTGYAEIDGMDHPISIAACRRLAAGSGIIPAVLGSKGEILDWGREKRLFTRAQRLALAERDGGCAMCGLPPGLAKAHHLRWWQRDTGPTDLTNGVLLCDSCHHRVHDNGWDIRIDDTGPRARVWFIPPPHIDPTRTPRLGGRARYDIAA